MERNRIVFSGSGGQGVITASIILAEAAVLSEDLNAIQSQSYGPEARGGATRADVIISEEEINFPKVSQPNTLICLTQTAYNKYNSILRPGGILITDVHFVPDSPRPGRPAVRTAHVRPGHGKDRQARGLYVCVLGALIGLVELVSKEAIEEVLARRVPRDFLEMNRQALDLGYNLTKDQKK